MTASTSHDGGLRSPRSPDDVDAFVGRRVAAQRRFRGVSQARLAKSIGVAFQQLQKYENGANRISAGRLFQIAAALECAPGDFFPLIERTIL